MENNRHSESEYVTLACQLSPSTDKTVTVHLKVDFHDRVVSGNRDVLMMQACAVIVGETATNTGGVYEGTVSTNEVAVASRHSGALETIAENKSVGIWMQDARAALTGQCTETDDVDNVGKHDTEYVYCVQNTDRPEAVILSWKIKHKFCTVTLGSIRLSKVIEPSELIRQISVWFIRPVICSLLTEKDRHKQVTSASLKTKNQLLQDNQLLIDQLNLMTESRQRDDQRMMARFLEILNTKKLRIAELQNELSQLKQEQKCENSVQNISTEEEEESLTVTNGQRRRGKGRRHDGYKKNNLKAKVKDNRWENYGVALKKQKTENMNLQQDLISQPTVMDVDVCATANEKEVKVFPVVDNLTLDPFEANTQVDPDSENSLAGSSPESPSWLQPSSPIHVPEQLPMQSSPVRLPEQSLIQSSSVQKPPEQKSVLDTLWGGIL